MSGNRSCQDYSVFILQENWTFTDGKFHQKSIGQAITNMLDSAGRHEKNACEWLAGLKDWVEDTKTTNKRITILKIILGDFMI